MFRELCEHYHKTPAELEILTFDQLYLMYADKEGLRRAGIRTVTPDQLRAEGVIPKVKHGEARSLVQRIRQQRREALQRQKRADKRARRRQARREMQEARARGEC